MRESLNEELAVIVRGLTKRFPGVTALSGVALEVRRGEFLALSGPDGAGKTTLLKTLCGLLHPDEGEVRVLREPVPARFGRLKRRVGYLPQRFSHYLDLTVEENIAFFARIYGVRDYRPRREALLSFTGLQPFRDRLAEHLSGGMKQKLALACTLIHDPDILILDEPTAGVDPASRREFGEILGGLLDRKMTIVMATPYLDEAERCHRTLLLDHGRVLAVGPARALKASLGVTMFEILCRPVRTAVNLLRSSPAVERVHATGERVHFTLQSGCFPDAVCRMLAEQGVEVSPWREVAPSLEDVFMALTRRTPAAQGGVPPCPKP